MPNSAQVLSGTAGVRPLQKLDIIVVLLLFALCVFEVATVQTIESPRTDSAVYMTLAHNIRETGRYEFNYRPHTVYPPGFPLLLVGISSLTGHDGYDVYIRFMPVFGTLAIVVWYFVLRSYAGRLAAAICCVLVATSDYFFLLATQAVLSDIPFFFLCGVAISSTARQDSKPRLRRCSGLFWQLSLAVFS
jgi:4-amino-4-deoxy-L-arabinose transferase-like glycosyltransferase